MSASVSGSPCATDAWPLPADPLVQRLLHAAAGMVLAVMLAACGTQGAQKSPPVFNLAGYSAQYKKGHADGCAQRRDDRQYREEGDYMMGWNDGRSACSKPQR